jgi:hypothetical protein
MAVKISALCIGHPLPLQEDSQYSFLSLLLQGHSLPHVNWKVSYSSFHSIGSQETISIKVAHKLNPKEVYI